LITASAKFIVHSRQEQGWNLMHNSSKPSSVVLARGWQTLSIFIDTDRLPTDRTPYTTNHHPRQDPR
jgi:hypothetical protein